MKDDVLRDFGAPRGYEELVEALVPEKAWGGVRVVVMGKGEGGCGGRKGEKWSGCDDWYMRSPKVRVRIRVRVRVSILSSGQSWV